MREIKYIVIHCTATPQNTTVASIRNYWRKMLGWQRSGYHYIIDKEGIITQLETLETIANGVRGWNKHSIHISYIGGVDAEWNAIDNRTPEQIRSMIRLIKELHKEYPGAKIRGHRDFPGIKKECPSFDVKGWIAKLNLIS